MERVRIDEQNAEQVVGGSIVFTTDHTSCGYNKNNEYRVNDYSKAIDYIVAHCKTMGERVILQNLVSLGYITPYDA